MSRDYHLDSGTHIAPRNEGDLRAAHSPRAIDTQRACDMGASIASDGVCLSGRGSWGRTVRMQVSRGDGG